MGSGDVAVPRALVLLADWSNIAAGVSLVIAFATIAGAFTFDAFKMVGAAHSIMQVTMTAEGVFWAVAAAALTKRNIIEGNAVGAVQQTIICFGGIFFAISGLGDGTPGKVISLRYTLAPDTHVLFADVCPYYGITCFMVATAWALSGVWGLDRSKWASPFWGVFFFFLGAWIIGVISLWGPTVVDGFIRYEDMADPDTEMFKQPTFAYKWTHLFQVLGAIFLTIGGFIFGQLDNIFGIGGGDDLEESDFED